MAISSVSSTNPLDQLAQSLVQRFDANQDGQLTTDEFTSFLSSFLSSISSGNGNALGLSTTTSTNAAANSGPKARLEGFDMGKINNPSNTHVKYKFGRIAQNFSLSSVTDKASAEALLNSMKPQMQAAGIDVLDVKGDKIQVKDDAGQPAWIDVIRATGSSDTGWQWMDTRY